METNAIEVFRDEAIRLINVETALIQRMLDSTRLLAETDASSPLDGAQTMDRHSANERQKILEGERIKLVDLEMVLAVVGTMKAGKSTTINAIVGTEVLPNRNRPMTALPTLIRHTPGQIEPFLRFAHAGPIEKLVGELRSALASPKNKNLRSKCLNDSDDISHLIRQIESGESFQPTYKGAEQIFIFLRSLNDLVRLSADMGINFPFDNYTQINEIPVIEVEFAHLRETGNSAGRLALLDTPGPNEAGQPHLKKMLREQLRKASAVLAILDFTQLKSDADAQVRDELLSLAKITEDRLYVLVNKFDQKDRNGDDQAAIKAFVADTLLNNAIDRNSVFPVSSKWAYLANRARQELRLRNALPDPTQNAWVSDFGEEAFGRRWEHKIADLAEVEKNAEALWHDSLISEPLEKVLRSAHARAGLFAVESAAAKLIDTVDDIESLLTIRHTALKKSTTELRNQISALKKDLDKISQLKSKSEAESAKLLKELAANTEQIYKLLEGNITKEIAQYFKEGKRIEAHDASMRARKEKKTEPQPRGFQGVFASIFGNRKTINSCDESDFDPESPIIKFTNKEESTEFLSRISKSISAIYQNSETQLQHGISELLAFFENEFQNGIIKKSEEMLSEISERLSAASFSVKLRMPKKSALKLDFTGDEMLEAIATEKQKTVTRHRRKSNAWGRVCKMFNTSDWGWEEYNAIETWHEVDIRALQQQMARNAKGAMGDLSKSIEIFIREPMSEAIEEFFLQLNQAIMRPRADLEQGIKDKELNRQEQDQLEAEIDSFSKYVPSMKEDIMGLHADIKNYAEGLL